MLWDSWPAPCKNGEGNGTGLDTLTTEEDAVGSDVVPRSEANPPQLWGYDSIAATETWNCISLTLTEVDPNDCSKTLDPIPEYDEDIIICDGFEATGKACAN